MDQAEFAKYLNQSRRVMPGPAYYKVLKWVHRILNPANYLEIGVDKGVSLEQARPDTPCIGVDPSPQIEHQLSEKKTIYELTSDEFFARYDPGELLGGPVELAFIDGLHLFEQVLRDFVNVERSAAPGALILLHDCIPLDAATASRERTTDFYCGDVWKATLALRRRRPDLEMAAVPTAPTGLCLVRSLDSGNRQLEAELPEIVATYRDLGFDDYLARLDEMPERISNEREAVRHWLRPSLASYA